MDTVRSAELSAVTCDLTLPPYRATRLYAWVPPSASPRVRCRTRRLLLTYYYYLAAKEASRYTTLRRTLFR